MADTLDTIVRRLNSSGMSCSRATVEQAAKAFARLGEAFGNAASQLAGAASILVAGAASLLVASNGEHDPRQQQLAITRRFKTRRLRKKYGQE